MKQSVSSAQIDECAEIGNIFNSSLYNIANCDACEQFFLQFLLLSNDELFAVTDDASSSRVELGNNEFNFLICIFRQIFFIYIRYKAGRNEYSGLLNNYG